jgi:hypothetical protein
LGACKYCINGTNAERAKQIIVKFTIDHSLTVRVSKDVDHPQVYDVYENGKIREESYPTKSAN